jgi:hypothetical protein
MCANAETIYDCYINLISVITVQCVQYIPLFSYTIVVVNVLFDNETPFNYVFNTIEYKLLSNLNMKFHR